MTAEPRGGAAPPEDSYLVAVAEHRWLVERLRTGLALLMVTFSAGPLVVAVAATGYGLLFWLMLALAAGNAAWSSALWWRVEQGRGPVLEPRPGEAPAPADDPLVAPVKAELDAMWPRGMPQPAVTLYVLQSIDLTPSISTDPRGVAVLLPEGFLDLWWSEPEAARGMLAHEVGHVVQDDVRLWTGLERALSLARIAAPIAWAEIVAGTVAMIFAGLDPGQLNVWVEAAAFWALALAVTGLRWVVALGPQTLALSELMADHFAVTAGYRRGLLSALSLIAEPPPGHHLPLARRRAALAPGAPLPWAARGAPSRPSLLLLASIFVFSGGIGYAHGVISDPHLEKTLEAASEIRRREDGSYVFCVVRGGACTRAWDPDRGEGGAFVSPEQASGQRRNLLWQRLWGPRATRELGFMPLAPLLRANSVLPSQAKEVLLILGTVASGYVVGYALGVASDGDPQSWWARERIADPETWRRLTRWFPLRYRFPNLRVKDPPPWRARPFDPARTRVVLSDMALTFDGTELDRHQQGPFGSYWLHAVDLEVTLLAAKTRELLTSPTPRKVELSGEQLDLLLVLPDEPRGGDVFFPSLEMRILLSLHDRGAWCETKAPGHDPRDDEEDPPEPEREYLHRTFMKSLTEPELRTLRRELVLRWRVPPGCVP